MSTAGMNVQVRMTLTAPACPAAQTIPIDVERRVREVPGVNDVKVSVVWDPPWTRDRMSEAAKLTLGHVLTSICHLPSAICHLPSAICHLP